MYDMDNQILKLLYNKNIAVVGNGSVCQDYSKEIDSADIVIRFNHFYNYDSNLVGKKVDIIFQTFTKTWIESKNKHLDVIAEQKPKIYIVKKPQQYGDDAKKLLQNIQVKDKSYLFRRWTKFTTGTCVLAYLAQNLKNAEVKCYGFQDEKAWQKYLETDAKHYQSNAVEERKMMLGAISRLSRLTIKVPEKDMNKIILIPIKAKSQEAYNKNRLLINNLLSHIITIPYPIHILTDDTSLKTIIKEKYIKKVNITVIPEIEKYSDVTNSVKVWQQITNYNGDIALTICTAPYIQQSWIIDCLDKLKNAPFSATACDIKFKATALYKNVDGRYVVYSKDAPFPSVARQLLPKTIRITGAVVAFNTEVLDKESIYDVDYIEPVMIDEKYSLDVDTIEDLEKALEIINNNK